MSRAVTGIRPTGDLSVANYVGAMKPILEMQETYGGEINIFVADLHGMTDQEPDLIASTRMDTVRSFLAAGVNPERSVIYLQTQIEPQTTMLASYLDRHVSIADLMRVPNLKDKLRDSERVETASVALARYPILMAADIFIQDAVDVPVGKDQEPHIEFARRVGNRFNSQYGNGSEVLIIPRVMGTESIKIESLDGEGKMSKSRPNGSIFLKDAPEEVKRKVKKAKTGLPGEPSEILESHLLLCTQLATVGDERIRELVNLYEEHKAGGQVMGPFKKIMASVVVDFLGEFDTAYRRVTEDYTRDVLSEGGREAGQYADTVLEKTRKALGLL